MFFRKRKPKTDSALRDMLDGYDLPSFPDIAMRVLGLLRDPEASMAEIAMELQKDPAMLVKVLRTVNAAAYGLKTKIDNVNHAVTMLGRSRLESIVLTLSVRESLPDTPMPWFDTRRFWRTASLRGNVARQLALRLHASTEVEAFTAGLLQDMAVPLIARVKDQAYRDLLQRWGQEEDTWLHKLETEAFGFDHATVGSMMAEQWNLSPYLVKAIADHHKHDEGADELPSVRLASYIRDTDRVESVDHLASTCHDRFGIVPDDLTGMISRAHEDAGELATMLE